MCAVMKCGPFIFLRHSTLSYRVKHLSLLSLLSKRNSRGPFLPADWTCFFLRNHPPPQRLLVPMSVVLVAGLSTRNWWLDLDHFWPLFCSSSLLPLEWLGDRGWTLAIREQYTKAPSPGKVYAGDTFSGFVYEKNAKAFFRLRNRHQIKIGLIIRCSHVLLILCFFFTLFYLYLWPRFPNK